MIEMEEERLFNLLREERALGQFTSNQLGERVEPDEVVKYQRQDRLINMMREANENLPRDEEAPPEHDFPNKPAPKLLKTQSG